MIPVYSSEDEVLVNEDDSVEEFDEFDDAYLFCHACQEKKSKDSFSAKQQKEQFPRCLIHAVGQQDHWVEKLQKKINSPRKFEWNDIAEGLLGASHVEELASSESESD